MSSVFNERENPRSIRRSNIIRAGARREGQAVRKSSLDFPSLYSDTEGESDGVVLEKCTDGV